MSRSSVTKPLAHAAGPKATTRIQRQKREQILAAALEVFSRDGFTGASINVIARTAGLTTPNLLYYFASKDAIRRELLERTLQLWMSPLNLINPKGDPIEEICLYVRRKLEISRNFPRESRLFAFEVLSGLPRSPEESFRPLKTLHRAKLAAIEGWIAQGEIAAVDPHHLMYSIWATTQHYADFEAQIREVSPEKVGAMFEDADAFLTTMYRKLLTPSAQGAPALPAPPPLAASPARSPAVPRRRPAAKPKAPARP